MARVKPNLSSDLPPGLPESAAAPAPVMNERLAEQYRQAEAALRRSEERARMAIEAGGVGIWDWDIAANTVEWSDRVYELHGVPPDQPPGGLETFRSHVHPEDLPRVEASLAAALAGGPPYAVEYRLTLPDGRMRWLATQSHIVRDAQGKPVRMVGGCTDVTERMELLESERRARSHAEHAEQRLKLLARAGEALSRSLDPDETLRAIGEAVVPAIADWCRIDLLDEAGSLQRRLAWHSDAQQAQRALRMAQNMRAAASTQGSMASVVASGTPFHGDFGTLTARADATLHLYTQTFGMGEYFILPLVARGRTIGAMAVIQAESKRPLGEEDRALILELGQRAALALDNARLYREAERLRVEAESASRAKDEFLAMLGHELRNPLAPIATALEVMSMRAPESCVDERRVIGRQVTHLSRLIDDLLDVSRIAQGKIQLQREPVDLRAIAANAVELTRPVFDKHRHTVEVREAAQPLVVDGDPVRLTQVLCNLLVNAAKFTPADGHVRLSLSKDGGDIVAVVEDDGAGIDAALLSRVFDLFVQGRQEIDRQSGGLGLGLALVRSMTQLHGGSVTAESDGAGRGSRFTVRLPASGSQAAAGRPAPAETALQPGAVKPIPVQGRILVVDDNTDAAGTVADLLRLVGYEVQCAGHANAALAALEHFRPDVALLDIGLPDIDGYKLAGLMRSDPRAHGTSLVALTGYGQDGDRSRAMSAHFDEHLVKPVAAERLLEVLRRFSGPSAAA